MNYWRWVWHVVSDRNFSHPLMGGQFHLNKIQYLRSQDGPIRTVFLLWIKLTCNWFVIGLHCARKGHEWRDQHITIAPHKEMYSKKPGVLSWRLTGKMEKHSIRACAWCGKYMGAKRQVLETLTKQD